MVEEKVSDEIMQIRSNSSIREQVEVEEKSSENKILKNQVRFDSFDVESGKLPSKIHSSTHPLGGDWKTVLKLAFQSIGIVYGDLGTSPLYVLPGIFQDGIKHNDDLLGVLSLIFYALTFITLIKYVFIVLAANDNGDGGTFALYSLICRYAKVSLMPNQQAEDKEVSNYRLDVPSRRLNRACAVKSMLEKSNFAKYLLLFITMLGTSMIIGDGILTPCISVLSAVGGIREAAKSLDENTIMWISVAILFLLFNVQRFGTDKVGYTFAPILTTWFIFIGVIGFYNFIKYDPTVIKAINPMYIVEYFIRNKKNAWISLGGVILCLTGSEALFADLGHFSVRSIQISTCSLVYPSIVLAYIGQISYLRKHTEDVSSAFYSSVPDKVYWPMFVVAVLAAIIASQSLISASFSIVQQSLALGCFPTVKVVHTSTMYIGQIYIPEINFLLMFSCIAVTLGFKNTLTIGNAYGLAVVFVMFLTSCFLVLVMIMIWKTNVFLILTYVLTIMLLELTYLSSVLYKFADGGYLPLIFSALMMLVMYSWNYVFRKKYAYDLENKVTIKQLEEIASDPTMKRLPGLAVFYSEFVHGVTPLFSHYISNVPALHSVLLFVTIKSLPISKVLPEERFLFRQIKPYKLSIFRCVVRYGYAEERNFGQYFEEMLVDKLKEFIRERLMMKVGQDQIKEVGEYGETNAPSSDQVEACSEVENVNEEVERELQLIERECDSGVVYLMGQNEVIASKESSLVKRIMVNYAYNFLKRCLRQHEEVFGIPRKRLLKVGMTYEL